MTHDKTNKDLSKQTLSSKSISAVFWGGAGTVIQILLQFCSQVVLARLLGPEQYGLFAIGAIVVSLSNFFSDIGIAYGLIQKDNVTREDVRFVFTWQFILGTLVTLVIMLYCESIGLFFEESRSVMVIKWLAFVCFFNAVSAPSLNILKRSLNYKFIKLSQVGSYFIGYIIVGIPLAFYGYKVESLIAAWLTQSFLMAVFLYCSVRHSIIPLFWCDDARNLLKYGFIVFGTNLTNWVINNVDRVIVGKFFTGRDIGLYTTPYNILNNSTMALVGIIQPVFFSATARVSNQTQKIETSYRSLVGGICLFIMPVFLGVSAVSDTFILTIYGADWLDASQIFCALAVTMPFLIIWGVTTPLLWAGGKASSEFKFQLPLAIVWIAVILVAAKTGLIAVAWTASLLCLIRCLTLILVVKFQLNLNLKSLWFASQGGVFVSTFVALGTYFSDMFLRKIFLDPYMWLLGDIFNALLVALFLVLLFPKLCSHDVLELVMKLSHRLPKKISRLFDLFFQYHNT